MSLPLGVCVCKKSAWTIAFMSKDSVQIDQLRCEHTQSAWRTAFYKWCVTFYFPPPHFFFYLSYIVCHLLTLVDALIFVGTLHTKSALATTHYSLEQIAAVSASVGVFARFFSTVSLSTC